ncbi:MAG TPA: hypothetical protein P5105_06265 [Victivallales bacterium]|nr:hypothetical protein [Victivallales bacterium]HPO89634.1 hypothetical protein [Victivallales bacterium]HRR06870.1 hypothetical protein [Victivallales bacterium]HRR28919.1 hypothetical protein [Victivallales bacterium]HRU00214.1 hypothetical protein [Victivallales bacterium]
MINREIKKLLALQEIDLKIRSLNTRLETIPIEIKKITEQIENEKKVFEIQKENSLSDELEIKKIEAEIKEKEDHIRKLQNQSSMIRKNDEYRALMSEIDNIKNSISELETKQLILMENISQNKTKIKDTENKLKIREKQAKEEINDMKEIEKKIHNEISKLTEERKSLLPNIDNSALSNYERILSKGKGIPVSEVKDSICGNCHIKITPFTANQARKGIFTLCDNCSHIIYLSDDESEN